MEKVLRRWFSLVEFFGEKILLSEFDNWSTTDDINSGSYSLDRWYFGLITSSVLRLHTARLLMALNYKVWVTTVHFQMLNHVELFNSRTSNCNHCKCFTVNWKGNRKVSNGNVRLSIPNRQFGKKLKKLLMELLAEFWICLQVCQIREKLELFFNYRKFERIYFWKQTVECIRKFAKRKESAETVQALPSIWFQWKLR